MSLKKILKTMIPGPVKEVLHPIWNRFLKKNVSELSYWQGRLEVDNGTFNNSHYKKIMLAIAEESDDEFLRGKVVADFGCGPRGSLAWLDSALLRIGIDVLADRYADEFTDNITAHEMIYLKSTERVIPLPSEILDVMFTLNAIDHVDNFSIMCAEVIRVLKPGGLLIASFNLEEPASPCEPQQLNEKIIKENLLNNLDIQSYRLTRRGPEDDPYAPFFDDSLSYQVGEEGFLWVRARKPE